MSELRMSLVKALRAEGWEMSGERAVIRVWPIIEAELQKRDKLLEQSIYVLAGGIRHIASGHTGSLQGWVDQDAKPLLGNLKALKKEETE